MNKKIILFVVLVILLIVGYLLSANTSSEINLLDNDHTEEKLDRSNIIISHNMPSDWLVYSYTEDPENEWFKYTENRILRASEEGPDPAHIEVYIYNLTVEESLLEVKTLGPILNIEDTEIQENKVVKRVSRFGNNECTEIQYFHEINNNTTGLIRVTATCPTYSIKYNEQMLRSAESVTFSIVK